MNLQMIFFLDFFLNEFLSPMFWNLPNNDCQIIGTTITKHGDNNYRNWTSLPKFGDNNYQVYRQKSAKFRATTTQISGQLPKVKNNKNPNLEHNRQENVAKRYAKSLQLFPDHVCRPETPLAPSVRTYFPYHRVDHHFVLWHRNNIFRW